MDKTTIYLPTELHASLKELSRRTGKPRAVLVREALEVYVATSDDEAPWPKTIGMFDSGELPVSSDEVEDWLLRNWQPD